MAADREPDWLSCLPSPWTHGVCEDGRVFFINDQTQSTSWLHPVSGEAAVTGHRKTADLPTGWEEGYTFEGARCFINHNERKVTCKHPVSGVPSQDNCIFVVNEQTGTQVTSEQGSSREKKERPVSEASNVTGGSDYSSFPRSPTTSITTANTTTLSTSTTSRPSRSSKKLHNFGKRSNSIKRNINAPVVKNGWIYKQDSTGMKLWKKRWFVLSDLCLFYYRDEKEDSILGSILLPSFHISMLSVDDHISKKYAFKATHPNMRTYYFCTDSAKEMESWMKVMTDAALGHTEPVRRLDKLKVDPGAPRELNNQLNHRVLTRPVIQNNERNRELQRQHSLSGVDGKGPKDSDPSSGPKVREYYTLQRDGQRYPLKKDEVSYMLQKEQEVHTLHRNPEQYSAHKGEEKYSVALMEEKYAPSRDREKYLVTKDGEKHALQRVGDRHTLQRDLQRYVPQKEVRRSLSLKETERYSTLRPTDHRYGTIHVVDKHGTLKEVKKYSTLREGDKYAIMRDADKYATVKDWEKLGIPRDTNVDRSLTRISSIKLQPAQAAAIAAAVSASRQSQAELSAQKPAQVNGSGTGGQQTDSGSSEVELSALLRVPLKSPPPAPEPERSLSRSDSMQQLQDWVRTHRAGHAAEEESTSIMSYQTLPRNMPSQRAHLVPRYPEGYRTMPRNCLTRPDSICSTAGSIYDRGLPPTSSSATTAEKRRSMRDDTMWQLYEWQQRQAFSRQSVAQPTVTHYGTLPNTKTTGNLSIPPSPSHGSLALFKPVSAPPQQSAQLLPNSSQSEATSPNLRAELTLERRHRTALTKQQQGQYSYSSDRRSTAAATATSNSISPQTLQGKTPEELTLLLIKLRRQQAELNTLREHTVAQLSALGLEAPNAKTDVLSHHLQRNLVYLDSQTKENEPLIFMIHTMIENSAPRPQLYQQVPPEEHKDVECSEEADIDTKLSVLCEQDKAVRTLQDKLQQLHREKHTLETAFLSASQELSEQRGDGASTQSLMQQRDVLQNGLLSTCRELSRVTNELERCWRDYDWMEADVTRAKASLLEQLEALGSPQTEPPSQQHIQIQKELWRIQDVMEVLSKNKPQRLPEGGFPGSRPLSSQQKNEQAPDYRLYKSEPELTTVKEEGDETHTEDKDKTDTTGRSEDTSVPKGAPCSAHVVPPRTKSPISPPESSTIASYVTLRKSKKPESRSDRPRSAFDQFGFIEREVCRTRMSVEEQLERMRRNQEASTLREKKKDTLLSRSPSFNKLKPFVQLQPRPDAACAAELKEQQQPMRGGAQSEDTARTSFHPTGDDSPGEDVPQHRTPPGVDQLQDEALCPDKEEGQRTNVVTGELGPGPRPQHIRKVELPSEQDGGRAPEKFSSPSNSPNNNSFQIVASESPSPDPTEEGTGGLQQASRKESLETTLDFYSQLKAGDQKHNNNNNLLAAQTFTLVSSDT